MKMLTAKVLDSTHLELAEPLASSPGEVVEIRLVDKDEEESWRLLGSESFLRAYDEEDAIYDDL